MYCVHMYIYIIYNIIYNVSTYISILVLIHRNFKLFLKSSLISLAIFFLHLYFPTSIR